MGRDLLLCLGSLHEDQRHMWENPHVRTPMEAESSLKNAKVWLAAPPVQTDDPCLKDENITRHLDCSHLLGGGGRGRLLLPFL